MWLSCLPRVATDRAGVASSSRDAAVIARDIMRELRATDPDAGDVEPTDAERQAWRERVRRAHGEAVLARYLWTSWNH